MTDLITEARELYDGWAAYDIMRHGGGQGAKSDDGEAERKFMLWIADEFPAMCDALENANEQNKQLMHELCKLACESVERDIELAKLEAEVMAACDSVRWIPVTERLPEIRCVEVLAIDKKGVLMASVDRSADGVWFGTNRAISGDVTHWMPLPAPPEDKP